MNNIVDKMAEELKTFAELQVYSNSLFQTVTNLNKKINELEEKNKELQKILESNLILIGTDKDIKDLFLNIEDPEAIALMQLKLLRNMSIERELTLEETRRFEIYCKILDNIEIKRKEKVAQVQQSLSNDDLLSAISSLEIIKIK